MPKGNNARDKVVKEQQKELVLKYRAQSYSFRDIAELVSKDTGVKITYQTAFNDYIAALEVAKKQVEKTATYGLISELEKLDRLERKYWEGWEKSIGNLKRKTAKKSGKKEEAKLELSDEDREQGGDVAFLNGIKACIELRCKMMGYITSTIDIKSNGKELAAITGMVVT
jgi:hypothetical protein